MQNVTNILAGYFRSEDAPHCIGKTFSDKRVVTCYEIELYCNDFFYSYVNGARIPLRTGALLIARPGDERYSKLHFSCHYLHLCLDESELKSFFDSANHLYSVSSVERYKVIFEQIAVLCTFESKNYYKIKALLYELIHLLQSDSRVITQSDNGKSGLHNAIFTAMDYIEQNFATDVTLNDLAGATFLHPNYLLRLFKKALGVTPIKYLNDVRLNYAKYLLGNTNEKVSDVAKKCGFSSQTYFSYAFKKAYGDTPTKYALMHKKSV